MNVLIVFSNFLIQVEPQHVFEENYVAIFIRFCTMKKTIIVKKESTSNLVVNETKTQNENKDIKNCNSIITINLNDMYYHFPDMNTIEIKLTTAS